MEVGTIVRIKANAIKNGLLKEKMQKYMFSEGIVVESGSAVCVDEVSVDFNDGFSAWIMPYYSLEIIEEPKKTLYDKRVYYENTKLNQFEEDDLKQSLKEIRREIRIRLPSHDHNRGLWTAQEFDKKFIEIFGKELIED